MKRYLIFFGIYYESLGGMEDFLDFADTLEEVQTLLDEMYLTSSDRFECTSNYWSHVYDSKENIIISTKHGKIC